MLGTFFTDELYNLEYFTPWLQKGSLWAGSSANMPDNLRRSKPAFCVRLCLLVRLDDRSVFLKVLD
jgi:hypothetical protein